MFLPLLVRACCYFFYINIIISLKKKILWFIRPFLIAAFNKLKYKVNELKLQKK